MRPVTRRAILAGLAAAMAPTAASAQSRLRSQRAMRPWLAQGRPRAPVPLNAELDLGGARRSLRDWLEGRPAVLVLWATWCAPCLAEKPSQAMMARRLAEAGAPIRMLFLQSYDDRPLATARAALQQLRAGDVENARASPDAEARFIDVFGVSPVERGRTSLPAILLLDGEGAELGRALGMMVTLGGRDYWRDDGAFELLRQIT